MKIPTIIQNQERLIYQVCEIADIDIEIIIGILEKQLKSIERREEIYTPVITCIYISHKTWWDITTDINVNEYGAILIQGQHYIIDSIIKIDDNTIILKSWDYKCAFLIVKIK